MYGIPMFGNYGRQQQINTQQYGFDARLTDGIKNGSLNRDEATRLWQYDNQTHQMEGEFMKDGYLSESEKNILGARNRYNERMMALYGQGDFHPLPLTQPQNAVEARMQNQFNRTFNGIHDGSLTRNEGIRSLQHQGNNATEYGRVSYNFMGQKFMSPFANMYMNNRLNGTGAEIFGLRHNFARDMGSPVPPNMSWGNPFAGFAWNPFRNF